MTEPFHLVEGTGLEFEEFDVNQLRVKVRREVVAYLADLEANTGDTKIGHTQGGVGSVTMQVQQVLREQVHAAKFGLVTDMGTVDNTDAMLKAMDYLKSGADLILPRNCRIKISDELPLVSGQRIYGRSNVDPYYGTKNNYEWPTMIYQSAAAKPIFTVGSGVCDLSLRDMVLSSVAAPAAFTTPSAGKYGIKFQGSRPNSSYRMSFKRMGFYNFERAMSVVGVDTGAGVDWQCDSVTLEQVTFWNNLHGLYLNTMNADAWRLQNCVGIVAQDGDMVHLKRSGFLLLDTCYAGPSPLSVSTFATGNSMLYVEDYYDTVKLTNSQAESMDYMLRVDATTGYENNTIPIELDSCQIEAPILVERTAKLRFKGGRATENITLAGDDIEVHDDGLHFETGKGFVVTGARPRLFQSPGRIRSVATTSGVASTMLTIPASTGSYALCVWIANAGALYVAALNLICDGTNLHPLPGHSGANLSVSVSGRDVRVTQVSGAGATVLFTCTRTA